MTTGNPTPQQAITGGEFLIRDVSADDLDAALLDSPWRSSIPERLRNLRERVGGERQERLSSA